MDECASAPCGRHGQCSSEVGSGRYTCSCDAHWSGPNCAKHICDAANPLCSNGGSCVAEPGSADGFRCECKAGFEGERCNGVEDPCTYPKRVNCGAHGVCEKKPNGAGAQCKCSDGYTGRLCANPPGVVGRPPSAAQLQVRRINRYSKASPFDASLAQALADHRARKKKLLEDQGVDLSKKILDGVGGRGRELKQGTGQRG